MRRGMLWDIVPRTGYLMRKAGDLVVLLDQADAAEFASEAFDIEFQLSQLHLKLIETATQTKIPPAAQQRGDASDELPF